MFGLFLSASSLANKYHANNLICLSLLLASLTSAVMAETLTRGPYLQLGTEHSMTVKWRTDITGPSVVKYGIELSHLAGSATGLDEANHSVTLSGLTPNTRYYYAVLDNQGDVLTGGDSTHFFYTSPSVGSTALTRAWIIGDSGTANSNARAVRDAYKARIGSSYTSLWIMLGDNAYSTGTDSEYQAAVFDIYPELLKQSPLWSTLGNHDGATADSASQEGPYYDIFTLPTNAEAGGVSSGTEAYYSFDYGQIHFVCLESYETDRSSNGAMLTWLVNDLEATSQPWIVAYWHHPPYTKGSHDSDSESRLIEMRENALPILESYGVDLVLSGHSHSYERSFLIDSHYGHSSSFTQAMQLDAGDGNKAGDGSYQKTAQIQQANNGAVYVVAGSSGKISGGALNHPAMYASINLLGSVILEVLGNELTATFIDNTNAVQDEFTLTKGPDVLPPTVTSVQAADSMTVKLNFSENLTQASATDMSHYQLDNGASVISAQLSANQRQVTLSTSTLLPSQVYTLVINGIQDISLNTIAVNTQQTFTYINLITIEFQDGVSPELSYSGTRDAFISELNITTHYGASTNLYIDGDDGNGNDLSTLLKWDIDVIPANANIESAAIILDVFNPTSSSYDIFALSVPWNEAEVSWQEYAAGITWELAGGQGVGDRSVVSLASISPGTGLFSVNLNDMGFDVIESWVDGSSSNHGFIITNTSSSDGADFYSRESSSFHPKLTLVYSLPEPEGDTAPPTQVENLLLISVGTDSASISWDAASDNVAVTGYKVFRDDVMLTTSTDTSFNDSSLTPATHYIYKIIAFDAANNDSVPSNGLNVTTQAVTASLHVEDIGMAIESVNKKKLRARAEVLVEDNVGIAVANASVLGSWSGLSNLSVSGVTTSEGRVSFDSTNVNKNSSGQFIFSVNSISLTGYGYQESDNIETSGCIGSANTPCDGLSAPTGFTASFDGSQILLNWSPVTQATHYYVHRSLTSASDYSLLGQSSITSYQDSPISLNTTYYYSVSAGDGVDESDWSLEVAVTTTVSLPTELGADDVSLSLKRKGRTYDVIAQISVKDDSGNGASQALVSGYWTLSDGLNLAGSGTTSEAGILTLKLTKESAQSGDTFFFTVTGIERGSDSFDGVMTSGSVTVP
ncbi:DNRLRE domain-containing protein [Shewanella eurypsychrophilus]|uniref:DNRLRE domain-containing protein n=1 Tax=Shewanella eurypsychrophilus TaxID=2593656 RepID=A0ABX8S2T5_9GAMM|nr:MULTISPECIES: DNRLRE domain-containing protein [Shewanella]QFU23268.1 DNRLRE domain-containing protein [Shewanella sp. YLB-09]QXP44863.1 DNRLRE domain-containing protein [Shewanella eurypsychrophilus]